jgi:formimidoylglutamate deiminase
VAASTATPSVAQNTYLQAVHGGAQASGRPIAGIAVGQNADLVELDCQHRALAQLTPDQALSGHVFGSSRTSAIRRVWTQGILRVDQKHLLHQPAQKEFIQARTQLLRHIHD